MSQYFLLFVDVQYIRPTPAKAPLHPWEWPTRPWARVHIDHAGPYLVKCFQLLLMLIQNGWMFKLSILHQLTQQLLSYIPFLYSWLTGTVSFGQWIWIY